MQYIEETLAELAKARERFDSVIVSYSGGKDSLAVMDMCVRTFKRVDAFMMEFVPGLSLTDAAIEYAEKRWSIRVRRMIHWVTVRAIAEGCFCDTNWKKMVAKMSLTDVYVQARLDTGLDLIATGAKRADGIWRRRVMNSSKNLGNVICPIAGWQKAHVLAYLKLQGIPIPKNEGSNANGVDLSTPSLLWLHDNHPDDFKKLCEVFPYAEAVIWRRTFYGTGTKGEEHGASRVGEVRGEEDPPPGDPEGAV